LVGGNDHFDDVEAVTDVREVEHAQPGDGSAGNQILFIALHRFGWVAKFASLPGLYLNENEFVCVEIAADEINFTSARGAIVPIEDLVSGTLEMLRGKLLTFAAESVCRVLSRGGV
jgi:hypothetical protein